MPGLQPLRRCCDPGLWQGICGYERLARRAAYPEMLSRIFEIDSDQVVERGRTGQGRSQGARGAASTFCVIVYERVFHRISNFHSHPASDENGWSRQALISKKLQLIPKTDVRICDHAPLAANVPGTNPGVGGWMRRRPVGRGRHIRFS